MDCSVAGACGTSARDHVGVARSSAVMASPEAHRAKLFSDLLSQDPASSHVYVSAAPISENNAVRMVSSLDSIRKSALNRFEIDRLDRYSDGGGQINSQLDFSADLITESMRFQVEMVSLQLMSSVVQSVRQGVNSLLQQQG